MRKTRNNYVPAEYGGYMFPRCNIPDILPGDAGKVLTVNETETGIEWKQPAGGSELIIVNETTIDGMPAMDKTWQEIYDALAAHKPCYFYSSSSSGVYMYPITSADSFDGEYRVGYANLSGVNEFSTDSSDGYPALSRS